MSYSADGLSQAAEMAANLAKECLESAGNFDEAWRQHCEAEARRHQERADWYLERKSLLEQPILEEHDDAA